MGHLVKGWQLIVVLLKIYRKCPLTLKASQTKFSNTITFDEFFFVVYNHRRNVITQRHSLASAFYTRTADSSAFNLAEEETPIATEGMIWSCLLFHIPLRDGWTAKWTQEILNRTIAFVDGVSSCSWHMWKLIRKQ